jgi:hypothetical protein
MRIILSELADTSSSSYSEMESIVERMSRLSNWGNARNIKAILQKLIHRVFGAVANTPGTAPSLSADEARVIMQDALNQQPQRLGVPRMAAVPPSSTLPTASSRNYALLRPLLNQDLLRPPMGPNHLHRLVIITLHRTSHRPSLHSPPLLLHPSPDKAIFA